MTPDRPRLDSWKEIAQYLGRDVRTVIRWERERGLPVSRVPGAKRSGVFAYRDELDDWLTRSERATDAVEPPPHTPASSRWPNPVIAIVLAAAVIALASLPRAGGGAPVQRVALTESDLQAFGARDVRLWSRRVTASSITPSSSRWSFVGDLDGDRAADVLAAVEAPHPSGRAPIGEGTTGDATLWRYRANGDVQWSYTATEELRFGADTFSPPWALSDLFVHDVGRQRRIAWAVHHYTWWPSVLISLDTHGNRLGTFVNAGWIRTVEATPDNKHLLVAGVSNSQRSYFLAVLDAARPFGRSPEAPGSATECLNCEAGDPIAYFVWPRSDVSAAQPFPAAGPSIDTFANGTTHVQVHETPGPNIGTTIYELSPTFRVQTARFSDAFWEWHDRLHGSGVLNHPASNCPERAVRPVRVWTRDTGWQTVTVSGK